MYVDSLDLSSISPRHNSGLPSQAISNVIHVLVQVILEPLFFKISLSRVMYYKNTYLNLSCITSKFISLNKYTNKAIIILNNNINNLKKPTFQLYSPSSLPPSLHLLPSLHKGLANLFGGGED